MTAESIPIRIVELLQLTDFGIHTDDIRAATMNGAITMASEKLICVQALVKYRVELVIINMDNITSSKKINFSLSFAVLNPILNVIAYKNPMQVLNLDTGTEMKPRMKMNEYVTFVRWIDAKNLAIVTQTEVFHWCIEGDSEPKKFFQIDSSFRFIMVTDYTWDENFEWFLLATVLFETDEYVGTLQLYSTKDDTCEVINGHAAAFVKFKMDGNSLPSTLLCVAARTPQGGKLRIREVGPTPSGNQPYPAKEAEIYFPPDDHPKNIPKAIQICTNYGVICVITRFGYIHLYDLETASLIYMNTMSDSMILATVPHKAKSGFTAVNRNGQVLSVSIDENNFIPYIKNVVNNSDLASRMAVRNKSHAEDLLVQKILT